MAFPEVNKDLLRELQAMGFSEDRAAKALQHSGNSLIEAAIDWIIDHQNDEDIDEMPLAPLDINIEAPDPSQMSDRVKLKAQQLREQARRKKEEEEKKLERNREKERIRADKDLMETKRIAEENERKRYIAQRKAEKEEERRARERIRQKLEQDKAERRGILGISREVKGATSSLPERKNLVPIESATLSDKSSTKLDLLRECLISLKRRNMGNDAQVKRAFQTLLIYVTNVANYPEEGKFRKIRLSNPPFQSRVGNFREGVKFLELCGFQRDGGGEFLYLPRDKVDMALLKEACNLLHSAITNSFFGLLSSFKPMLSSLYKILVFPQAATSHSHLMSREALEYNAKQGIRSCLLET
ncbi:hypothetical protein M9H77_01184 [Catharanthus roseus]|uniref:Uncharacterized protein n=1 Tax=Catharanthus roseus TaxID=4058 RepID=A0ACC0C4T0_CATRO|nr:hypothetical protein M9H77_01184 [Catharanthus roseus]